MPNTPLWELDDLEPAASQMEARLLYPRGRRPAAVSPLLGSVVPAVIPRLSRVELGMLGGLRAAVSPTVLPARAPSDALVDQIRVRSSLLHFYLDRIPDLERVHRDGVDALCDVATVLHLERWVDPQVRAETLRPLRQLVGPDEELGFGPSYAEVLDVLHSIADFTASSRRTDAVTRAWMARRRTHWDDIAAELCAAATVTGRQVSLRMVTRVLAVSSRTVRGSNVFRATRLRAAAVILGDLVDQELVVAASEPWLAGVSSGPAAA